MPTNILKISFGLSDLELDLQLSPLERWQYCC